MMKYAVEYAYGCESAKTVLIENWWRFVWWILTRSRKCSMLIVYHVKPLACERPGPELDQWSCEDCPEWDECGGLDKDTCKKYKDPEVYT